MIISKWDLFKRIEKVPNEKYPEIKEYLDGFLEDDKKEVMLDEQSEKNLNKSLKEFKKGEYVIFDQVFEKGDNDVWNSLFKKCSEIYKQIG